MKPEEIPVGGIAPLSTIDWPERISCVLFLRGCPWRCPYCHNPDLQSMAGERYDWSEVQAFLEDRRGFLDGVVFSGGEPTMHPGLPGLMAKVRDMGFDTALHTGGGYPGRLESILEKGLVDWVGFDLKAAFEDYPLITGSQDSGALAARSLQALVSSGVPYELRTTVYSPVLDSGRMGVMAADIQRAGAGNLVLQQCLETDARPGSPDLDLAELASFLVPAVGSVAVRLHSPVT